MNNLNQYYETLGIKPGASAEEVKQAYRALARRWHPDRAGQDPHQKQLAEAKLKAINEAYAQLKDHQPSKPAASNGATSGTPATPHGKSDAVAKKPTNAKQFYDQAVEAMQASQLKEAIDALSAAIRLSPNYAEAYKFRGHVYSLMGLELSAEADLTKAKQLELLQKVASPKPHTRSPARSPAIPLSPPPDPLPHAGSWQLLHTLPGSATGVMAMALSPDGKLLAQSGLDGSIHLWSLKRGQSFYRLQGHTQAVNVLAFSADGQWLVSGSHDRTLRLWHLQTGDLIRLFAGQTSAVTSVAISRDRVLLLSGHTDGSLCWWDLRTGDRVACITESMAARLAVTLTHDGRTAITGAADQLIRFYHLQTMEPLFTLTSHPSAVNSLVTHPNQRHFATGGSDGGVRQWNLVAKEPQAILVQHPASVHSLAYSPDGHWLASGSDAGSLYLQRTGTTAPALTLAHHRDGITALAFDSSNRTLFSSSLDGSISVWHNTAKG